MMTYECQAAGRACDGRLEWRSGLAGGAQTEQQGAFLSSNAAPDEPVLL